MAGENFDAMAISFANIAANTFKRRIVFQRTSIAGETQTDDYGFPSSTYTDLTANEAANESDAIPCQYIVKAGKEVFVDGKQKTVTLFQFTIPRLYKNSSGVLVAVEFGTANRLHLLASGVLQEQFLQVISGGKDLGPGIGFDAIELEQVV